MLALHAIFMAMTGNYTLRNTQHIFTLVHLYGICFEGQTLRAFQALQAFESQSAFCSVVLS